MSHKRHYHIKPSQNIYLQRKWDEKNYEIHKQKLHEAKAIVDTKAPKTYMHVHLRLKTMQLHEEKIALIERDNRILLEKLSRITRTKGAIDNKNDYPLVSLNLEHRQRELLRIAKENHAMLKRIQNTRPIIDNNQLSKDWEVNEQMMEEIAAYPYDWWEKQQEEKKQKNKEEKKTEDPENDDREADKGEA